MRAESLWMPETQQQVFRELTAAFSRPGELRHLSAAMPGVSALRAALAVLMDGEVTLSDPHGQIPKADWPLLQAKAGEPGTARYVVAVGGWAPDFQPALGSLESPEYGATLLLAVEQLGEGPLALELSGPGIPGKRQLCLKGLDAGWVLQRADWTSSFPLGADMLIFDAEKVAALPRTTRLLITQKGG